MESMNRKILSTIIATLLISSLTACGQNNNKKSVTNSQTTSTITENTTTETTSEVADKDVVDDTSTIENSTENISEHDNVLKYSVLAYRETMDKERAFYVFEPAQAKMSNGARTGSYVTYLGNGGTAEWTVEVKQKGSYMLWVEYCTAEDREVDITVNGNKIDTVMCESTGKWFDNNSGFAILITLDKGKNSIMLSNEDEYAPNVDWIGISRVDGSANIVDKDTSDYTYYTYIDAIKTSGVSTSTIDMAWYGEDEYVLFDRVKVDNEGKYKLNLEYTSSEDFQYLVQINDNEPIVVDCTYAGSVFNYGYSTVEIQLNKGIIRIKIQTKGKVVHGLYQIGISQAQ